MDRKQLKCPACGRRLIDEAVSNKSELVAEENIKVGWEPDYYLKCSLCKRQIGIKKVS